MSCFQSYRVFKVQFQYFCKQEILSPKNRSFTDSSFFLRQSDVQMTVKGKRRLLQRMMGQFFQGAPFFKHTLAKGFLVFKVVRRYLRTKGRAISSFMISFVPP